MKAILQDHEGDGSISVYIPSCEATLVTVTSFEVTEIVTGLYGWDQEPADYDELTDRLADLLYERLGCDWRSLAGLRRAIHQMVEPGPPIDQSNRVTFEV